MSNQDSEFTEEPLIQPKQRKQGCCQSIFRCFCCCCVKNKMESSKKFWKLIWEKFTVKHDSDPVYTTLLHLYSQQPAIAELENCSATPVFSGNSRQDLEFYIPQLCNLLLYIYTENLKDLLTAILKKCEESFYFSHRMLWFLRSTNFSELDPSHLDPLQLMEIISKISKDSQVFFVEKGEELETLVLEAGMDITDEGIFFNTAFDPTAKQTVEALQVYASQEINILKTTLHPKLIPLNYFNLGTKADPFSATLSFIEELTNISTIIMRSADKKSTLQQELEKLNTRLPACVYIPFSNRKIRNSYILHIPISEAKVFTTKERAPYLICIEVFQPLFEFQHQSRSSRDTERSKSGSMERYSLSFSHGNKTSSFIERAVKETIQPDSRSFAKSLIITSPRPTSMSVTAETMHYERFNMHHEAVTSLTAIYEIDEENKSEDVINSFKKQAQRIREKSPYGSLKTWALIHVIVKSGDDLRQEQLAMQLISFFLQTFKEKKLKLWLYAYDIIATGPDCGILECVPDAISIDALKKATQRKTLIEYFIQQYGGEESREFKKARKCFMVSLAGYSLLCYFLQIKDRHNGNILLDRRGHLVHIDFGFMLSNSPGGGIKFENAPFKLTNEFEELLGGRRSRVFLKFRSLCVKGYMALKEKAEQIFLMTEMMRVGSGFTLGCFKGGEESTKMIRERLVNTKGMSDREYINSLIDDSLDNWSTRCYDKFQYCCQNILY